MIMTQNKLSINYLEEKKTNVELLKYYTSSEIMDDFRNSVSYASILFK